MGGPAELWTAGYFYCEVELHRPTAAVRGISTVLREPPAASQISLRQAKTRSSQVDKGQRERLKAKIRAWQARTALLTPILICVPAQGDRT